jgi:hypothetical protein
VKVTVRPPAVLPADAPTGVVDEKEPWSTGRCWFWCGRESGRVRLLGRATAGRATVALYGCETCIRVLEEQVFAEAMGVGLTWGLDHLAHGPPTGRHRRSP